MNIQHRLRTEGFWLPFIEWILNLALCLSIGNWLNKCLNGKSNAYVSEFYQIFWVSIGLIWLGLIEFAVSASFSWRVDAAIAFYRPFEIFIFSLHWLLVAKGRVGSYRRSLVCFIINLFEIGIFYAIAYLLLDWFDPQIDNWEAMRSSLSVVFRLETFANIKPNSLFKFFDLMRIVISWTLIMLILGNVIGAINRGEKRKFITRRFD